MVDLLKESDFIWKELYSNNMPCNGIDGYYCLIDVSGGTTRTYTLLSQREKRKKDGSNIVKEQGNGYFILKTPVEYWILLEKLANIEGDIKIPEPSNDFSFKHEDNCLHACTANGHGSFIRVYTDFEEAKKGAYEQYISLYGFTMAHMEDNIDDAKEHINAYKDFMKN